MPSCHGSQDYFSQCPWPHCRHCWPTLLPEASDTHAEVWLMLLWGLSFFLLGPGAYKVLFCPRRVCCLPRLWKFWNQIPLAFKVKFPGVAQSLNWIPSLGILLWALEPLQQCKNIFGIIVLQFVGHLLSSSVVELMATSFKRIYATCSTSQVCCSQNPCPHIRHCWQVLLQKTLKARSGSDSCLI